MSIHHTNTLDVLSGSGDDESQSPNINPSIFMCLTVPWGRREGKVQMNKHWLMRMSVCEELVEVSVRQREQES